MFDEIVSKETAKLAKDKFFKVECDWFYTERNLDKITYNFNGLHNYDQYKDETQPREDFWSAPTQSLLQKWLRDIHQIVLTINYEGEDSDSFCYVYCIQYEDKDSNEKRLYKRMKSYHSRSMSSGYWSVYEEALEKGLQEALKLINNE